MSITVGDMRDVDWLAVEFVCGGTPMRLGDDRATLAAAVLAIGYHLTVDQIAERLGTNTRRVSRILDRHGAESCPLCGRNLLLHHDGTVPSHVHQSGHHCRMTGHLVTDTARRDQIRADSRSVARLR